MKDSCDAVTPLRARLNREFPGTLFYFLPADIVSQTLNFGLPAPFDVQIVGRGQDNGATKPPDRKDERAKKAGMVKSGFVIFWHKVTLGTEVLGKTGLRWSNW